MSTTPRVTVLIPTYNRAAQLVEAVASVEAQSFRDYEILICDDGSTDDTATRVRSFGSAVRYLRLEHRGLPGAVRNQGINAARGEFIAFLDDDDLWESEKLSRQVERIDREPDLDIVYTDRCVLLPDGSRSAPVITPSPRTPGAFLDLIVTGEFPHLCTALVRRELLLRMGGFDESLPTAADMELWLRLARFATAGRVAEPLTIVRRQTGSFSDRSGLLTCRSAILVLERQLEASDLRIAQRLRCHTTLAHLNAEVAATLLREGDRVGAQRAALHSLRHRPVSSAAWAGVLRASFARLAL